MLREVPAREYEHSEVLLYHAFVLEEAGELEPCLEFLGEHAGAIVDRQAYSVQRGESRSPSCGAQTLIRTSSSTAAQAWSNRTGRVGLGVVTGGESRQLRVH